MITYWEALEKIKKLDFLMEEKIIGIEEAVNNFLAEDIFASCDNPACSFSAMDGWAVNSRKLPGKFKKLDKNNFAGSKFVEIKDDETVYTATGACLPNGADLVAEIEIVAEEEKYVVVNEKLNSGRNVVKQGEDFKKGDLLFSKGTFINEKVLAVLVANGIEKVKIFDKPKVIFVTSGDEIVDIGEKKEDYQFFNITKYVLGSFFKKNFIEFKFLHLKDEKEKFLRIIDEDYDLLVFAGSMSVGKKDFVVSSLKERGFKEIFYKVAHKPGKPVGLFIKDKKIVLGLPGKPVSAFVQANVILKPLIYKILGANELIRFFKFKLGAVYENKSKRSEWVRVKIDEKFRAFPLTKQDSSLITSILADAIIYLEPGFHPIDEEVMGIFI